MILKKTTYENWKIKFYNRLNIVHKKPYNRYHRNNKMFKAFSLP